MEMLYKPAKVCQAFPSEPWHPNPGIRTLLRSQMSGFGWKCFINLLKFARHFHPNPGIRTLLGSQMSGFGWTCFINLLRFAKHFHRRCYLPRLACISDVGVRVEMLYKPAKVCQTFPSEPWHPNPDIRTLLRSHMSGVGWKCSINLLRFVKHFRISRRQPTCLRIA